MVTAIELSDPNLLKRVEEYRSLVESWREKSFLFSDEFPGHEFEKCEEAKQSSLDDVEELLDGIERYGGAIAPERVRHVVEEIKSRFSKLENHLADLGELANQGRGVHYEEFKDDRNKHEGRARSDTESFRNSVRQIQCELNLEKLKDRLSEIDSSSATERLNDHLKEAESLKDQISKILEQIRTSAVEAGVQKGLQRFQKLSKSHAFYSNIWLAVLVIAVVIEIGFLFAVAFDTTAVSGSTASVISLTFRRVVYLSIPIVVIRISLTKYNTERNLKIIYDHRQTVLDQFEPFEAGIGDDPQLKSQFRLEFQSSSSRTRILDILEKRRLRTSTSIRWSP